MNILFQQKEEYLSKVKEYAESHPDDKEIQQILAEELSKVTTEVHITCIWCNITKHLNLNKVIFLINIYVMNKLCVLIENYSDEWGESGCTDS